MKHNNYDGLFVAVDGPNGVGKSTLIKQLASELNNRNIEVCITKEPTDTCLGQFVHQSSEYIDGYSLACLVAADRYQHLQKVILPQLKAGKIVITDRYILSSLILQRIDNVDENFILAINEQIVIPDIQIAIKADINVLQSRLGERDSLTRFEKYSLKELEFMQVGIEPLKEQGIRIIEIDNTRDLLKNVSVILKQIMEARK